MKQGDPGLPLVWILVAGGGDGGEAGGLNWMSRWPICPEEKERERESRMGKAGV